MTTVAGAGTPLLRVVDLHTHFRVAKRRGWGKETLRAVNGVSFTIERGRTLGLVGESGCGKSTLGRTLLGLYAPSSGAILLNEQDLARMNRNRPREYRRLMQVVFQDPYASLDPSMTVHDIVAEPLMINGEYRAGQVEELLDHVGLPPSALRLLPAEFSGGQRQRIAIARALALNPNLLILDEAVSALDVSIQAQVINLLRQLQRRLGVAYLFISHNLSVVRHISHDIAVMYLGRIVEIGPRDQVFDRPRHPYTQALLSAVPVPDPRQRQRRQRIVLTGDLPDPIDPPTGCAFRTRCFRARPECANATPELAAVAATAHRAACFFPSSDGEDRGTQFAVD